MLEPGANAHSMATQAFGSILDYLRRVTVDPRIRTASDQELLEQFIDARDSSAFEAVVCRHARLVLDVCRGILVNESDVEDAFQATFLVLAQKAASIRNVATLATWLHSVAFRTALKARTEAANRHKHESSVLEREIPAFDCLTWTEVRGILHEELAQLSDRYREPLVLCYLQGATHDAAAPLLGLSKGTLKRRLERGRALLRVRLLRRGLGPEAILLAATWPVATAGVARATVVTAVQAASLFSAGPTAARGLISLEAVTLSKGVIRTMFLTKLKTAITVVVTLVFLTFFGAMYARTAKTAYQENETTVREALSSRKSLTAAVSAIKQPPSKPIIVPIDATFTTLAWSPDGTTLATVVVVYEIIDFKDDAGNLTAQGGVIPHSTIKLWNAATGKLERSLGEEKDTLIAAIAFSADTRTAAISASKHVVTNQRDNPIRFETEVRVLDTRSWSVKHRIDGFATTLAFSPDGKTLALGRGTRNGDDAGFVRLWDLADQKLIGRSKGDRSGLCLAFSSDGKNLATGDENGRVRLFDGRTGATCQEFESPGPTQAGVETCITGIGFSPDGKILISTGGPDKTVKLWDVESRKLVRKLDGNNAKITALAVSPGGKLFATVGFPTGETPGPAEVLLWDTKTGKSQKIFPDQSMTVNSLAFSPDGSTLALACGDAVNLGVQSASGRVSTKGELKLWKVIRGRL